MRRRQVFAALALTLPAAPTPADVSEVVAEAVQSNAWDPNALPGFVHVPASVGHVYRKPGWPKGRPRKVPA